VVKTQIYKAARQSQDAVIGSEVEKKFRLVIRFPEWRRVLQVVKLPTRTLRVGEPQVLFLAEKVPPELYLYTQLESDLALFEVLIGTASRTASTLGDTL
jgi:hypothetical protein